jgi:hypothetical protein
MAKTARKLHVTYGGRAFLPAEHVDIKPNSSCVIMISDEKEKVKLPAGKRMHSLKSISQLSVDMGPSDLSENFDQYVRARSRDDG